MWICPYCGAENFLMDRIGMEEPNCRACGRERKTVAEVEKEIDGEIKDLKVEMKDLRLRMEPHIEMIACLESDLAEEKSDLKALRDEYKDCKRELARLEALCIYTSHDKVMAAMKNQWQKTLSDFILGGLFQQKKKRVT